MDETRDKIYGILRDTGEVNEEDIKPESTLATLGLDSLDVVDALLKVEDEFEITIPDEEAQKLKTVDDLVSYVETKIKK